YEDDPDRQPSPFSDDAGPLTWRIVAWRAGVVLLLATISLLLLVTRVVVGDAAVPSVNLCTPFMGMLHPIYPQLVDAFIGDLAAVWAYARHQHPKETPYAFVLYGVEAPTQLGAYVLTNEGLSRSAQEYVDQGEHQTIDEAREALRW